MGIMRVSNSFNFEKKIKSFCQPPHYEIEELDEDSAVVNILDSALDLDDGYHRFFTINLIDDIVQFGMPSPMLFETAETIPDPLSTLLLKINSYSLSGFWCLEEMDEEGSHSFVYTYNVPKISLNKKQFDAIIDELVVGCMVLEEMLDDIMTGRDDDEDDDSDPDDFLDPEDDSENPNWNNHENVDNPKK
jgi:hypothetical protein